MHRFVQKFAISITVGSLLFAPLVASAQGIAGPYMAAQQAERRGDVAAAARLYSRTLARDGENTVLLERAMLNQLAAGNIGEGIALARRQEVLNPGHHLGVLALAADALQKRELEIVRDLLTAEGPFVGQVVSAWAAFADDDADTAIAALKRIETSEANGRPGQIVGATHLGMMLAAFGDDAGAVAAFERASNMSDGGSLGLVEAHASALARLGKSDSAVNLIENRLAGTFGDAALERVALEISNGAVPGPTIKSSTEGAADVLYGVARLLARGQNRSVSLAYAQLAAFLNPDLTDAQLLLAQIFDATGQFEQAIAAYEAIPADAPEALSAMIGRGEALQASGSPDAAVEA
ncbi:MAG: hypothetical protein AB8B85_09885, partial [Paracoccaceae bacterium]